MKLEISLKEVMFGLAGTLLGGLVVTLFANNHSLESQLKAIAIIDEPLKIAIEKTTRADTNATNAIQHLQQVQREIDAARTQAQNMLSDLRSSELFTKGSSAMDELREIARVEANEAAEKALEKDFFSVSIDEHISTAAPYVVKFTNVEANNGNGWDGANTFLVPHTGFYEFSLSFLKDSTLNGGTADDVFLTVYKNGQSTYIRAWAGQSSGQRPSASTHGILELQAGDKIQVYVRADGNYKRFIRNVIFSGKLVATKN